MNKVLFKKIIIPAEHIDKIKTELNILGIRRSILFPDIENYARELRSIQKIESQER